MPIIQDNTFTLEKLRTQASSFFLKYMFCHLPLIAMAGYFNNTSILLPVIGAFFLCLCPLAYCLSKNLSNSAQDPIFRHSISFSMIGLVSILVFQMRGDWQIDMHMYYFAVFAMLAFFVDYFVIISASALTAVHHLILNFMFPIAVFPEASFERVSLHAVIVIAESGVLIWLTYFVQKIISANADILKNVEISLVREKEAHLEIQAREILITQQKDHKDHIEEMTQKVSDMVKLATKGDFSHQLDTEKMPDALKILGSTVNELLETVKTALMDLSNFCAHLAEGNLSNRIHKKYEGLFEIIQNDANTAAEKLEVMMEEISGFAYHISTSAEKILSGSSNLSTRTSHQSSNLQETAMSLKEFVITIEGNSKHLQEAETLIIEANHSALKGKEVVENTTRVMKKIQESSIKISEIISLMDSISFQTNLLSLNANVEAARAGEAGRGFSVVASEVRNLASNSAGAAQKIKNLIAESTGQINEGSEMIQKVGITLNELSSSVEKVSSSVKEISEAGAKQVISVAQINSVVSHLDELTQKNALLAVENSSLAIDLDHQSSELAKSMNVFSKKENKMQLSEIEVDY